MTISNFLGGMSTRLAPHLINPNQAVIAENIDLTDGSLRPSKGLLATPNTIPLTDNHFAVFNGTFVHGDNGTHFVDFNDSLYKSSTSGVISKSGNGIDWVELGLNKPASTLLTTTEKPVFNSSQPITGDASNIPVGTVKYIIGYASDNGKFYKQELSVDYIGSKGIKIGTNNTSLKYFNVYRLYKGIYYIVGSTSDMAVEVHDKSYVISDNEMYKSSDFGSSKDVRNYVYTYFSTSSGIESAPSELSTDLEVEINKVDVRNFVSSLEPSVDSIKLYRMGGSLTSFYLVDTLSITSIETQIYIDTKTDLEVLEGTALETMESVKPIQGLKFLTEWNSTLFACIDSVLWFSEVGTVDKWRANNWIQFPEHITGIGATQNGLMVFSRSRTWILSGESRDTYFKYLLNGSQGCITHNTISYIDNSLVWLSLDGICSSIGSNIQIISYDKLGKLNVNPIISSVYDQQYFLFHEDGCIVADFREGLRFYTLDTIVRGSYYSSYYNELYILVEDSLGVFKYGKGDLLSFKYKTGRIVEQGKTNYKIYKNVYVYNEGDVLMSVYVDGTAIHSNLILDEGSNQVKLDSGDSSGYFIELEFSGTGTISEIEFNSTPRQTVD